MMKVAVGTIAELGVLVSALASKAYLNLTFTTSYTGLLGPNLSLGIRRHFLTRERELGS
jgi:hypothetical protein